MAEPTPVLNNHKAYVAAFVSAVLTLGAQQLGLEIAPDLVAESHGFLNDFIASLGIGATTGLATWFKSAFTKSPEGESA